MTARTAAVILGLVLSAAPTARALEPAEVAVVYNSDFDGSKALAEYYVAKRGVPAENVLAIRASRDEHVDRQSYLDAIEGPIRAWLDKADATLRSSESSSLRSTSRYHRIRCVLLMRGVPLTINEIDDEKKRRARDEANDAMNRAAGEKSALEAEKKRLDEQAKPDPARIGELRQKIDDAEKRLAPLKEAHDRALKAWQDAIRDTTTGVDSELSVMYWTGHPVQGWLPNPLAWKTWTAAGRERLPKTFMTCRLDAPTDAIVKRVIDDSIAAEAAGLKGVAYFDAWHRYKGGPDSREGIIAMDELIRRAGRAVESTGMKTVIDDTEAVFQPGTCPNAAVYCGWYSLMRYVPAFTWVRGSVGYHVASGECVSLRDPKGTYWCKRMLEEGVAATLGPVHEPYVVSFPPPQDFFSFLLTGQYTMAEVYWYTVPSTSWMMTLVADPLYTPFKKNPQMTIPKMREAIGMPPPVPAETAK